MVAHCRNTSPEVYVMLRKAQAKLLEASRVETPNGSRLRLRFAWKSQDSDEITERVFSLVPRDDNAAFVNSLIQAQGGKLVMGEKSPGIIVIYVVRQGSRGGNFSVPLVAFPLTRESWNRDLWQFPESDMKPRPKANLSIEFQDEEILSAKEVGSSQPTTEKPQDVDSPVDDQRESTPDDLLGFVAKV